MNNQTVLFVDDNPAMLKLLTLLLSREGYTVQTATGGAEALEVLGCLMPDAVLTDLQMPRMNGLELTQLIRSNPRTADTFILVVSAFAMQANIDEARSAGCDGYITKPIDTRTFAAEVGRYLQRGRTAQPLVLA